MEFYFLDEQFFFIIVIISLLLSGFFANNIIILFLFLVSRAVSLKRGLLFLRTCSSFFEINFAYFRARSCSPSFIECLRVHTSELLDRLVIVLFFINIILMIIIFSNVFSFEYISSYIYKPKINLWIS